LEVGVVDPDWRFDQDELRTMESLAESLREEGWAKHVTVPRLLAGWRQLAETVNAYDGTIEEYLNDLTSRDGLELIIDRAPDSVRLGLERLVAETDEIYRRETVEDVEQRLRHFFRIADEDGWWWHRIPKTGPIATEIAPRTPEQ
jgi:hypothetical protein